MWVKFRTFLYTIEQVVFYIWNFKIIPLVRVRQKQYLINYRQITHVYCILITVVRTLTGLELHL